MSVPHIRRAFYWPALISLLLLAFALRLHQLGSSSLWLDEVHSYNRAALQSWSEVYPELLAKNHAPLYDAFLLHNWARLGREEFLLRFPMVIAGLLTAAVTFALARRLFSRQAALLSVLILALSPLAIFYSREVRMYALLALFVALAYYFLVRAIEPGAKRRGKWFVLTALASALALYTHYFAMLTLAGAALFALAWTAVRKERRLFGRLLLTFAAAGLLFSPWLPTFFNQLGGNPVAWIPETTAERLSRIVSLLFLDEESLGFSYPLFALLLVITLAAGFYLLQNSGRRSGRLDSFSMAYICCAAVLPFIIAIVISFFKPLIVARYFVPVAAPASVLLAAALAGLWQERWARLLVPALLVGLAVSAVGVSTAVTKLDWQGAAAFLEANSRAGDVILVAPVNNDVVLEHYYEGEVEEIVNVTIDADIVAVFAGVETAERVWLATVRPDPTGVSGEMAAYAENHLALDSCRVVEEGGPMIDLCLYVGGGDRR